MIRSVSFLFAVIFGFCSLSTFGGENTEATARYEKGVARLKAGDLQADFKALRLDCAESKYRCEADSEDKKAIAALLNENTFEEGLKKAEEGIDASFVDIDLHYFAFVANMELERKERAEFHRTVIRGLLDSIQENKRGRSEEDAFTVINVHEEYVFLRFSDMKVKSQALVNKDGHSWDVMVCTDMEDDREVTLYFNIDIPMKRLRSALGQ
ncbi:MAG: DUF4919 domain-containing protein [Acidobacteria bacterium]|nr:DUF4919 domain-containing protein [Acidobacteriota bacterium]